jgi:hypothetical protein
MSASQRSEQSRCKSQLRRYTRGQLDAFAGYSAITTSVVLGRALVERVRPIGP